jgi:hypothetical protein
VLQLRLFPELIPAARSVVARMMKLDIPKLLDSLSKQLSHQTIRPRPTLVTGASSRFHAFRHP